MLLATSPGLLAQDTINTDRYDYHFRGGSLTPWTILNGEFFTPCPNGGGFWGLSVFKSCDTIDGWLCHAANHGSPWAQYLPYMGYTLSKEQDVYGIAIMMDSIANFTDGDSLMVVLCTASEDNSYFKHLDSITIKGGEIGKRRWMEIPLMTHSIEQENLQIVHDDCIDTTIYTQVLEFYFDEPVHLTEPYLWWKVKVSNKNGSHFIIRSCHGFNTCFMEYYYADCRRADCNPAQLTSCFPIVTPLPNWEVPSLEQVIPWPAGAVIPDPQEPGDSENQDDTQNQENPEDPDTPEETEGIVQGESMPGYVIRPNPTNGMTTIYSPEQITKLSVCDMAGHTVLHMTTCGNTATLDTSTLRKGTYLVKVSTAKGSTVKKLVVE